MATTIWSDLKQQFSNGNMIIKLIMINVAIYLLLTISEVPLYLIYSNSDPQYQQSYYKFLMEWFWLPSDLSKFITRPWTIITYMFLHDGLFHLFFNMLLLYWFGRIINDLIANSKILPIYLLGGIMGALFFMLSYNIFPAFAAMKPEIVGSSAGVMGIVAATAVLHPHGAMRFILIGLIELQYVAWFIILLDVIMIPVSNAGGHIAHLGGSLLGWIYIRSLRRGTDIGKPINKFFTLMSGLFSRRQPVVQRNNPRREPHNATFRTSPPPNATSKHENVQNPTKSATGNTATDSNNQSNIHPYLSGYGSSFTKQYQNLSPQECIDAILDKIQRSTYNSLSDDEKHFLEKVSRDKLI
jgi:membrane associated rhomboid family serine protease